MSKKRSHQHKHLQVSATLYCSCGAALQAKGNEAGIRAAINAWAAAHHGAGHAPATARQAREARRRADARIAEAAA